MKTRLIALLSCAVMAHEVVGQSPVILIVDPPPIIGEDTLDIEIVLQNGETNILSAESWANSIQSVNGSVTNYNYQYWIGYNIDWPHYGVELVNGEIKEIGYRSIRIPDSRHDIREIEIYNHGGHHKGLASLEELILPEGKHVDTTSGLYSSYYKKFRGINWLRRVSLYGTSVKFLELPKNLYSLSSLSLITDSSFSLSLGGVSYIENLSIQGATNSVFEIPVGMPNLRTLDLSFTTGIEHVFFQWDTLNIRELRIYPVKHSKEINLYLPKHIGNKIHHNIYGNTTINKKPMDKDYIRSSFGLKPTGNIKFNRGRYISSIDWSYGMGLYFSPNLRARYKYDQTKWSLYSHSDRMFIPSINVGNMFFKVR